MKIEVRVYPQDIANLKAYASITLDKCFAVTGIKVLDSKDGLFVAMPASKGKDGEYHDVAFPVTREMREEITEAVLNAYNELMDEQFEKEKKSASKKRR